VILERGQPARRFRGIAPVLRPRRRNLARRHLVDERRQFLGRQVLVVILADLGHRRVGAGAEALDLFPRELAVGAELMRLRRDLVAADADQVLRPADHAGRGAADLDMRDGAHGGELEHEVEGRDLERPDMRHAQHVGHRSIAGRVSQPSCSCARHSSGMIALACRPSGYLVICASAQARFSGVKAKLSGCSG
jgi:hypothetical protein